MNHFSVLPVQNRNGLSCISDPPQIPKDLGILHREASATAAAERPEQQGGEANQEPCVAIPNVTTSIRKRMEYT